MTGPGAGDPPIPGRCLVVVLAKAPIRGFVKTRLAAVVGVDAALAIHRRLAAHVLAEVAAAVGLGPAGDTVDAEVRVTPDEEVPAARTWVPSSIRIRAQGGGDLGDRMRRAFDDGFTSGASRVVVVGTDCPEFGRRHLAEAFAALVRADLVLGPASDGGYWLIGARAPTPPVFDRVAWSTAAVLATTLERARASGRVVAWLETLGDVDTVEDLDRLHPRPPNQDRRP